MFRWNCSLAVAIVAIVGSGLLVLAILATPTRAGTADFATEVLADSPYVFYRFNETGGTSTAADTSGNGRTGTYMNSPTQSVLGVGTSSDNAVSFDGTNQYLDSTATGFGSLMDGSSFELVFKSTATTIQALGGTFNTGSNTAFEIDLNQNATGNSTPVGNSIRLFLRADGGVGVGAAFVNSSILDGNYHHLIYTYDSTAGADRVKAYVDGVPQSVEYGTTGSSSGTPTNFVNFTYDPVFAARANRATVDRFCETTLDEVALYGTVLTADDAVAHAEALGFTIAAPNQWAVDGGGSFNVATNWTDEVVPTTEAIFGSVLTGPNAPATITLDSPVSLTGVTFANSNQYILAGPSALTLTGAATVDVSGTHQITADIVGTAGFVKANTGTLVLADAKSYTGTTDVQEGTLLLNSLDAIDNQASGVLNTSAAGTVLLSTGATGTLAAELSGSGVVNLADELEPADTVTISRANSSFAGLIRVDDGTLAVANSSALGVGGTPANRTTLDDNSTAKIALAGGVTIANEVLDMDGRDTDAVGLTSAGTNAWNGVIDGQSTGTFPLFNVESTSGTLTLNQLFAADAATTSNPDDTIGPQTFVFSGAGNITVTGRLSENAYDDNTGVEITSEEDNVGVIKRGSGNLTIAIGTDGGVLDYWFGPTVVEEGTLTVTDPITNNQGELRSMDITVRNGTTLNTAAFDTYSQQIGQTFRGDGTIVASTLALYDDGSLAPGDRVGAVGSLSVTGNVTLAVGDGGGAWSFDVGNSGNTSGDVLAVSGTFSASGSPALTVNVTPAHGQLDAGSRTIVTHSGGANAAVNGMTAQITDPNGNPLTTRQTVAVNGNTAGQINVVVTGEEASRTWNGNVSGAWDVATSNNWQEGDHQYKDLDRVTFSDSATGTTTVAVDGDRFAGSVTFSNATKSYKLTGTGGIVGTGGVSVTGTGQVDLANTGNNYSGTTSIAAGGKLQMTSATTGSITNSGALSLRTGTTVNALVQNGAQTIGTGAFKVFAVEAENYQTHTQNGAANTVTWGTITAAPNDTLGNPAENPADPSLGGQALIASPVANDNTTTATATQDYVTYDLKFTEPGTYYWFGRMRAVDGGATLATGNTPDNLSNNDDSVWLPSTDLGKGVATPQTLSTKIDLAQTTFVVNGEGGAAGTAFFGYDWYRSAEGALAGDAGFEKIVVSQSDVDNGSVFQLTVAAREGGAVLDKQVFVRNPDFTTDPNFGTITDSDLNGVTAITATSAESFFSAGTVLNVTGDFTMTGNGASLDMLIGSPELHDQINITGNLAADGTLTVGVGNGGLSAEAGDVFDIFTFASASGAFDNVVLPTLAAGLGWDTTNLLLTGELSVLVTGLAGDYNDDGIVDAADYTVWRDHLGEADETALNGNGDGMNGVDEGDFALWKSNFGATLGAGSGAIAGSQPVPEPATIVLWSLAAAVALLWRRRRAA